MAKRNGIDLIFHHLEIPTNVVHPNERYSKKFGMFTTDAPCTFLRIQWHRFEKTSPLHPLICTLPHVAFKVSDLNSAITGANILLGPYEPVPGYRVAIIEDGGVPIELVETTLSDEELWARAETSSVLYS